MKEKALIEIMKKRSGIDFSEHPEYRNMPLMGKKLGMEPRELVYVFFDLENAFSLAIPEEAVMSGRFNTFDNILATIENIS